MGNNRKKLDPLRLPREGTELRRLYDLLLSGEPVTCQKTLARGEGAGAYIEQLRSFYNCEIETLPRRQGFAKLLGRWDGPYFVSIERL